MRKSVVVAVAVSALVLLALGIALALNSNEPVSTGDPASTPQGQADEATDNNPAGTEAEIKQRVVIDLADRLALSAAERGNISVSTIEATTWPDGCVGLAEANEICTQALVEGYRLNAFYRGQEFIFHTNGNATMLRLE